MSDGCHLARELHRPGGASFQARNDDIVMGEMGEVMADEVRTTTDLVALATWAEAVGFSTLMLRDHVVREPFGDQLGPSRP